MSIVQNAQPAGTTKNTLGSDTGSDFSCCTLPDDSKGTAASNQERLRESSSSSAPPGCLNFTVKSMMPKTAAPGSSISNASTQRVNEPAQPRGRSVNNNPKSRHAVHFASTGGVKQPGKDDPEHDRGRKAVASPPPPSATAFTRNPAAADAAAAAAASVNPERIAVSAGDGLSRIHTRESVSGSGPGIDPWSDRERRSSAPAAVDFTSFGGVAAVTKASIKKGWGPRQRAVAEAAALAHGGEGAEAGGSSSSAAAPAATGTFKNQSRLPKLEIPPLGETLQRYLGTVAPLLSPEAYAVTNNVVKEFETSGEGEELQRSLVEYSADKDSYVEEFWDDSYLTPKSSVVLNLNPFFVFETPTLSDHSKDLGDEFSDVAAGNRGRCSSCGGGTGGDLESRTRARSPRRKAAGRNGQRSNNDTSPPACYREHFRLQQQQGERNKGVPPSRRGYGANNVSSSAAAAGKRQARRAASLLYSSLRFVAAVRSETLPPDLWRDTPLCMAQFRRLFGAHRKAVQNDRDEMRVCEDSRHVVVLCKNQFYCFSALHADGRVGITEEGLEEIVLAVQEDAAKVHLPDTAARAVGALTTEPRDDWAVARRRLAAADETNKRYLHLVDTALFVLCLDHTSPCTAAEISASCLHGSYALEGDVQVGTCTNRWYDKLQIIVFENGAAGVNFEHTWVDGHTVLRFASDVFADVIYRFANHLTSTTGGARDREGMGAVFPPDKQPFSLCEGRTPMKMEWRLSKDMRREIYFAETRISDLIRQHDVQALEYDTFGKRFITQNKMSPDAFVQMAIVYGYYSLYGDVVAAYEPVLTKAFLKGRTEALRTVTAEVKAFLEAFCDPDTPAKRKILSLRSAIVSHGRLVKLAAKGKGVDRHLFALLCMAKRKAEESAAATAAAEGERKAVAEGGGGEGPPPASPPPYRIPLLFEDEAWRVLNHVILSTSNCGNPSLRLFGFGPVVRDGFGIGYIIKEDELKLVVTSKNRQTDRFIGKIREFFDMVFNTYSPQQVQGRVKVISAEETSDDSGKDESYQHKHGRSPPDIAPGTHVSIPSLARSGESHGRLEERYPPGEACGWTGDQSVGSLAILSRKNSRSSSGHAFNAPPSSALAGHKGEISGPVAVDSRGGPETFAGDGSRTRPRCWSALEERDQYSESVRQGVSRRENLPSVQTEVLVDVGQRQHHPPPDEQQPDRPRWAVIRSPTQAREEQRYRSGPGEPIQRVGRTPLPESYFDRGYNQDRFLHGTPDALFRGRRRTEPQIFARGESRTRSRQEQGGAGSTNGGKGDLLGAPRIVSSIHSHGRQQYMPPANDMPPAHAPSVRGTFLQPEGNYFRHGNGDREGLLCEMERPLKRRPFRQSEGPSVTRSQSWSAGPPVRSVEELGLNVDTRDTLSSARVSVPVAITVDNYYIDRRETGSHQREGLQHSVGARHVDTSRVLDDHHADRGNHHPEAKGFAKNIRYSRSINSGNQRYVDSSSRDYNWSFDDNGNRAGDTSNRADNHAYRDTNRYADDHNHQTSRSYNVESYSSGKRGRWYHEGQELEREQWSFQAGTARYSPHLAGHVVASNESSRWTQGKLDAYSLTAQSPTH